MERRRNSHISFVPRVAPRPREVMEFTCNTNNTPDQAWAVSGFMPSGTVSGGSLAPEFNTVMSFNGLITHAYLLCTNNSVALTESTELLINGNSVGVTLTVPIASKIVDLPIGSIPVAIGDLLQWYYDAGALGALGQRVIGLTIIAT